MWVIPIRMAPVELHIHADRRLAFQVLSAFGASQPGGGSSRVLRDEGGRKLVEFHTPIAVGSARTTLLRTVEWVTLHEPEAIDFEKVEGPLHLLRDRFILDEVDRCTRFRYESTFGVKGGLLGWLVGQLRVKPVLGAFMRRHAQELKQTIEERARRSRLFPFHPCGVAE